MADHPSWVTPPSSLSFTLTQLGRQRGRCIVAQEGDALIILDQHGAHERIPYEKLRENPAAPPASLERPVTAVLPEELAPEVWAFEADLGSLGFLFEPFGPDAVRVTAAPETAVDPEAAFLAALHALAGGEDLAKVV